MPSKEIDSTIVLILLQHQDKKIVERAAQILESVLGEQFVFHGVDADRSGKKTIETARCVLALRPEDIKRTKQSRWSQFDLARKKKNNDHIFKNTID